MEFRKILKNNNYDEVYNYISTHKLRYLTECQSIIQNMLTVDEFNYKNFCKCMNNLNLRFYNDNQIDNQIEHFNDTKGVIEKSGLHRYLNHIRIYAYLIDDEKSEYCYNYYIEQDITDILNYVDEHMTNPYIIYKGILKSAIEKKYINIVERILIKLTKNNINLSKYYPIILAHINIPIINLFSKYDPSFIYVSSYVN
jgi:hypothetical protein